MNDAEDVIGDDGLTNHERDYLKAPLKDLTEDQRASGLAIFDKRASFIYVENEKYREEKRAQEKAKFEDVKSAA